MSVATELVLNAVNLKVETIHLDTADRRDLSNVGKIDLINIYLSLRHGLTYLWSLIWKRPVIVYVPIAQDMLPFLRDCLFLLPARWLRKKIVVHLHGGHFDKFYRNTSPFKRKIIRYALAKTNRAIVLGTTLQDIFDGVIPRDRIRVIPNGIPDNYVERAMGTQNGHRHTILSLGTLMREKGTLELLEALPLVVKHIPDLKAVFAGAWYRPEEQSKAIQIIRQHGLESHTEFIGPVAPSAKLDVLKKADAFVMPTSYKYEGHPYVILEAMSAGLPVVSTKVGCIPETVIDGENGFILNPGDTKKLAEKLVLLLRDEGLRKKMGQASRARFLKMYTVERFAEQMNQVFGELLV